MSPPTPAQLGFRMPAEWEPHEATWLSWPHNLATWPDAFEPVPAVFVEIARHIASSELVRINVADESMEEHVRRLLAAGGVPLGQVRFHRNPTNDCWVRDHGPMYVVRPAANSARTAVISGSRRAEPAPHEQERAIVDWGYNAWGGKYPPFDLDDAVPRRVAEEFGELRFDPGMVLEGGSIEVNGRGLLLTTEACLLHPNRNPELSRDEIEKRLRDFLGVTHVGWLGDGIAGDDTDGHIDDMTRLVGPTTVVTVIEPDDAEVNFEPLQDNLIRLRFLRDQAGQPLEVVPLPMPAPKFHDGQRIPASYANFLICNTVVLVPTYRDPNDAAALDELQRVFPDRRVVGVDCTDLVWGLGAIHCATQQQPVGMPASPT
jgi:agmatine deiminase